MSKKLIRTVASVATIAVAIAAAIPTGGASTTLLATAAAALGTSAAVLSAGALALSLGTSLLLRPKAPATSSASTDRLSVSIDPRAPRAFVFGRTAMATDIRDQEYSDDQEFLHRFIVSASHQVGAFEEIWFDDKLAWSASGGITSDYLGYLGVECYTVGSAANAKNISARMGSSRRYTGLAWVYLRFKLTGNSKKAESPFAQSIPTRVTIIGKGALTYDPRLDSTVAGGSGAMRADDQTTWAWNDDASRNPAIQLLWYLLGWRIQNPSTGEWRLAVGKGIPVSRIDLPSFITAANLCDEPVTLAAGGTQPRYRSDGVFTEGDATGTVLDQLKAAMNAELDDVDGKIRLTVLHNDLATPIADFSEDDVLGAFTWDQTAALDETYNVIRGTFVDPSDTSLYQAVDYPEVRIDSLDGIDRVDTVNFQTVQDAAQAQRLVKQRIARMLYSGRFTATFGYRAWKVQKNDVVRLTFAPLGWTNKLFRVVETAVQVDGQVPMVLQVENADIYLWDSDERPAINPVEPTTYDPFLNPIYQDVVDPKYGDGTSINDLRPAEEGATAGASPEEKDQLAQLETDMATALAAASAAQTEASNAAIDAAAAKLAADQATDDVIAQGVTISQMQGDIIDNASSIDTLQDSVSSQESSITDLQVAATSLEGSLATLTTQVQAGNKNLIANGGPDNGSAGWTMTGGTPAATTTRYGVLLAVAATDANIDLTATPFTVVAGQAYVATCNSQLSGGSSPTMQLQLIWLNSSGVEISGTRSYGAIRGAHSYANLANRGANVVAGTAPSGAVSCLFRVTLANAAAATLLVGQAKAEAGTQWSTYTADASIIQTFNAISTTNGQIASLSTTVSAQDGRISANALAISSLDGTVSSLSETVSSQGSDISSLKIASSTAAGDIATLKTRVSAGGGNLLTNTEFAGSMSGWTQSNQGQTGVINFGINGAGSVYQVPSTNAATINQTNTLATGYSEFTQDIPAEPGKIYEFSTWYASHRCLTSYYVLFLNSSGADLGSGGSAANQPAVTGGNTLSTWSRIGFKTGTAPAGTVIARVYMRKQATNTGTTDSWAWFLRPQIIETFADAPTPQRYSSGTDRVSIETNASALSTLNTQFASLSTTVSTQGGRIDSNATAITSLNTNVATLTTRVASGSQNLMANGGFDSGVGNWGSGSTLGIGASATYGRYLSLTSSASSFYINSPSVSVDVGGTYTVSADTQFVASTGSMTVYLIWLNSSGAEISRASSSIRGGHSFDNSNTNRAANAVTGVAPPGAVSALVQFNWAGVTGFSFAGVRLVKFEALPTWTPYSSEASIRTSYDTITTLNTNYASLSTTVSSQGVTISGQQTAITTLNGNVTTLLGKAGVTVDVNGYVTGWSLNNNGSSGSFTIRSDRFRVVPPSGSGDGFYIDIDGSNRTTQYILAGGVRVVEIGWIA